MPSAAGLPTQRRSASGRATMASPARAGTMRAVTSVTPKRKNDGGLQQQEERANIRRRLAGERRLAAEEDPGVVGARRLAGVERPLVEPHQAQGEGNDKDGDPTQGLPGAGGAERDYAVQRAGNCQNDGRVIALPARVRLDPGDPRRGPSVHRVHRLSDSQGLPRSVMGRGWRDALEADAPHPQPWIRLKPPFTPGGRLPMRGEKGRVRGARRGKTRHFAHTMSCFTLLASHLLAQYRIWL